MLGASAERHTRDLAAEAWVVSLPVSAARMIPIFFRFSDAWDGQWGASEALHVASVCSRVSKRNEAQVPLFLLSGLALSGDFWYFTG